MDLKLWSPSKVVGILVRDPGVLPINERREGDSRNVRKKSIRLVTNGPGVDRGGNAGLVWP